MKLTIKPMTYAIVMTALLAGCGASSKEDTASVAVPETPTVLSTTPVVNTPVVTAPIVTTPVVTTPVLNKFDSSLSAIYDVLPDVKNCKEGVLKQSEKDKALTTMNEIRKLHGLPLVTYSVKDDINTAKSALIGVASLTIDHEPKPTINCYTAEGLAGSSSSNLHLTTYSATSVATQPTENAISSLLIDFNNVDAGQVGHRRWMLDPFLTAISLGRVDGQPHNSPSPRAVSVSLKIYDNTGVVPDLSKVATLPFVAYPYQANYPAKYFDPEALLSFSVFTNKLSRGGKNATVKFANAVLSVVRRSDLKTMLITNRSSSDIDPKIFNSGLHNILQWKVTGLAKDTLYDVKIENVMVDGVANKYSYEFSYK